VLIFIVTLFLQDQVQSALSRVCFRLLASGLPANYPMKSASYPVPMGEGLGGR
jgi:hypothetical protein